MGVRLVTKQVLYAVDKKGGIKQWEIQTAGAKIYVSHGKMGGKMQIKEFLAKPKNVGRANATTAEQQAVLEAASRFKKQYDKGYRSDIEDARKAEEANRTPMLAHDYTKVGHSIVYPCFVSPKLDGVRCISKLTAETVTFTSRGGKDYKVPKHLFDQLTAFYEKTDENLLDGELYIHGVSLQNIVSAVKKPNDLTDQVEFWIFDIPTDEEFKYRNARLEKIQNILRYNRDLFPNIKVVLNETAQNEEHARKFMLQWMEQGFEGMMLRNVNGLYEWNHRSRDLQKWKDFLDGEYLVIGYEVDALDEAVYHLKHRHTINGKVREYFKAKPRGNHAYRHYSNARNFVGHWVTCRFQQFTDAGVPQFPVVIGVRECTEDGVPIE